LFAKHHRLSNLTEIVDHNHLQADGFVEDILDTANLAEKFRAFGFDTQEVDGHDVTALMAAYTQSNPQSPRAIIAETVKGKGVSFIEHKYNWHYAELTERRYQKAKAELSRNKSI
jgi:transketolase